MEYIYTLITTIVSDPRQGGVLIVVLAAAATFTVAMALLLMLGALFDPVRLRLSRVTHSPSPTQEVGANIKKQVQKISPALLPTEGRVSTQMRLVRAGYRSSNALQIYFGIRLLVFVIVPLAVMLVCSAIFGANAKISILFAIIVGALSYIGPSFYLDRLVRKRQRTIAAGFPDVLDMLVVCTEAGLGLDAALQRTGKDLAISHPILAGELELISAEIRAGATRETAYRNLAARTGVKEIRGLIATLTQSLRFGSNVAEVLRVYSADFRDKRIQAAEEEAAKLAVKLIFPLVFCFMPSFFIITLGPAILGLKAVFGNLTQ